MPEIPVNSVAGVEEFSWEKDGKKAEQAAFTIEEEQARQSALRDKAKIDYSAGDQVLGQAYATNQYQDKTGQTGKVADVQDRKVKLQKAAVAAQFYSQEELVNAGYSSGKAIAKLKAELAGDQARSESYQAALDMAHAEADATGYLIDPIAAELNSQLANAQSIVNDITLPKADRDKAQTIINSVNNAYKEYGVSSSGQKTLALIDMENRLAHEAAMRALTEQANNINLRAVNLEERKYNDAVATAAAEQKEKEDTARAETADEKIIDYSGTGPIDFQF